MKTPKPRVTARPMSSQPDSHAKTLALPARDGCSAPDLPASVQDYGGKSFEPFAWFDHNGSWWKMWQRCLIDGWARYSQTWPRMGMTRNGVAFQLVSNLGIAESGLSLWPTLTARDYRHPGNVMRQRTRRSVSRWSQPLPVFLGHSLHPEWCEAYMGFPIGHTELEPLETP